ncbi:MAG: ABC transporter substrate-binding protein, partial [Erysipelotrichaceae bacterium]|nr:ABC transporter substrate-binding protein [Erysipelotrichaceae bacterium]
MSKSLNRPLAGLLAAGLLAGCSGNGGGSASPAPAASSGTEQTAEATTPAAPAETKDAITILKEMPEASNLIEPTGTKKGNVTMGPDSDKKTMVATGAMTFETLDPFYTNGVEARRIGNVWSEPMWNTALGSPDDVSSILKTWTVSEDGFTVDWELYDNIYDFEGNHITASDLQWFYDKYTTERTLANIESFVATGEYTGQMVLRYANYPGFLSRSAASIVAVSQAEYEKNPERFRSDPVGTGFYRCIKFTSGNSATFQQTYNYWGDVENVPLHLRANVDVVRYDVILEQQQIQTALETNTIQIYDIQASTAEDFINSGKVKVWKFPTSWPVVLILNSTAGGMFENNPDFRKAIAYAIDYEAVCLTATKGTGQPMSTLGFDGLVGYQMEWEEEGNHISYDLDKAKEYLEKAGIKPGEVTLRTITNSGSEILVVIQACLAEIGVGMDIQLQDEVQFLKNRFSANLNEWDMCFYGTVPGGFMMNSFYNLLNINAYSFGATYGAKD